MAATALAEENEVSACLNPSRLSCNKRLPVDVVKSAASINALQPKEMDGYHPVKVRKPYTITKQREKWTGEEHQKFVEALKLYGRSWRQIQEHIGTKTAVQIRSHAQKFFSKVEREPGASNAIEIPPPRPKRKPLHPYPRKYNSSTAANPKMKQPISVPLSSSSSCNQENGSPVSVLSAVQSDTFGLSISNPSTGCTSPVSSDGKDEMPALVTDQEADEENVPPQTTREDQFREELDQDKGLPEDNSLVEAQETSVKLFGRMVVVPDPRKARSSAGGEENHEYYSQSSNQDILQASSVQDFPAYTVPSEWFATHSFSPFHFSVPLDAKIAPLHIWWPLFPLPISHKCGLNTDVDRTQMDPLGESEGNAQASPKSCRVVESLGKIQLQKSAPYFELKPSASSAFVRGKPSSKDQSVRGFVPCKRCKIE